MAGFGSVSFVGMVGGSAKMQFEQFAKYQFEMESALSDRLEAFKSRIDQGATGLPEEQLVDYYDWHQDEHWELDEVFPEILRRSLFVATYSFLESSMSEVCRLMSRHIPRPVAIDDLRHKGVTLYNVYLKKVQGVPVPENTSEWQTILMLNKVRNFIVHEEGKVNLESSNGKAVADYSKAHPDLITLDQFHRIKVSSKCCHHIIGSAGTYFEQLCDAAVKIEMAHRKT